MAPMSGCTDLSFRLIAREEGAGLCFFEMIDCNSLTHNSERTIKSMLQTNAQDRPIAAQLVGADPGAMVEGAKMLLGQISVPFIDINAACPVNKVVKKKAGAYLMQKPSILSKIIKKLSEAIKLPVTVKLRIGFEKYDKEALIKLVKKCEAAGAAAIFIHGRTAAQLYQSAVNYGAIKVVKQSVGIPVFGSGNVMSAELAKKMIDLTGCDGIMVARGGLGNPFIYKEIEHFFKTGKLLPDVGFETRKAVLKRHLKYINEYSRIRNKVGLMRKVAIWYLKKFHGAAHWRDQVNRTDKYEDMIRLVEAVG